MATTIPTTEKKRHAAFLSLRQDALLKNQNSDEASTLWQDAYTIHRAAKAAGDKWADLF